MKKIIVLSLVAMTILAVGLFAGCSSKQSTPAATEDAVPAATAAPIQDATTVSAPAATAAQQNNGKIDLEEAKAIAIKESGFDASQIQFTETGLDNDDGIEKYEVEFIKDGVKYEYEIDSKSGAILKKSIDATKN